MTFFDKFFTIRSRNNFKTTNERILTTAPFSSSLSDFNKEQIRLVLFRECDKRGRKLLFDSNAVEKLPITAHIPPESPMMMRKRDGVQNAKLLDFVEVTNGHGYKYKKPSNDITLLGEMIFGSVAMVFKGENTCKIHKLSSPKRLLFTNIVHAPEQCQNQMSSGHYSGAGSDSYSRASCEFSEGKRTSSSDSKLYKQKQSPRHNISTYPCIKHKYHDVKKLCQCEASNFNPDCDTGSSSQNSSNSQCSEKLNVSGGSEGNPFSEGNKTFEKVNVSSFGFKGYSELSLYCSDTSQNKSEPPSSNITQKDVDEYKKGIFSNSNNFCNSLASWKRRWIQSCISAVEEINYEDTDKLRPKTKRKLGMGLVVELSNDVEEELEKFLFNHSIIIESILKKLQSAIETACIKREHFVDLTYTAFINCQQSMWELITGEKYPRVMWLSLTEKTKPEMKPHIQGKTSSQWQGDVKDDTTQDTLSNVKVKFLNDFCDVLSKFDTKDTNFFISTLLTAVLTHHLSWVTEIAESDVLLPQHKLRPDLKTLRPYNPIWAQLNDLNGILGSPLKCARTVVTGSKSSKNSIASVVQVLTYFIRCYNVVETLYDFDFEEIANISENEERSVQDFKNVDGTFNSQCDSLSEVVRTELKLSVKEESKNTSNWIPVLVPASDIPITEHTDKNHLRQKNVFQSMCTSHGMKKSNSCQQNLVRLEKDGEIELHPDVGDHPKAENICRLNKNEKNEYESGNNYLRTNEPYTNISHLVGVPSKTSLCHLEKSIDHMKDCDSMATSSIVFENTQDCTRQTKPNDCVLFVLGENEELVNLRRVPATESESTNLGKEHGSSVQLKNISQPESICTISTSTKDLTNNDNKDMTESSFIKNSTMLSDIKCDKADDKESIISSFHELPMPKCSAKHYRKRKLDVSSVLGRVNYSYNSEHIIQGVLEDRTKWESVLRRDLNLYAHEHVLDRNVTEALCIIGDMNSCEVSLISSSNFTMDKKGVSSIRIGLSKLVADMLESLLHLCKINLPADFCLNYIEQKLHEIYSKSKCVAELLNSTDVPSIEYLTSRLDISVNDVPLLLSVATTHSPHISSRYGITYT